MKKNFKEDRILTGSEREREILSATSDSKISIWNDFQSYFTGKKIGKYIGFFILFVSAFFAGSMIWIAICDLSPSLREACLHFFDLTYKVVSFWDYLCSLLCKVFGLA